MKKSPEITDILVNGNRFSFVENALSNIFSHHLFKSPFVWSVVYLSINDSRYFSESTKGIFFKFDM